MPNRIYHNASDSLAPFTPGGDPDKLNERAVEKPKSEGDEGEIDDNLTELGAGLTKAKKYSSLAADGQKIDIPKEGQESIYNRKS